MPIFFLIVGVMLIVVSINDKLKQLAGLVGDDFSPSGSTPGFGTWIVAIFVAGSLGYIKEMKPVANAFLVLIVIALLLSNKGFFDQFKRAVERT